MKFYKLGLLTLVLSFKVSCAAPPVAPKTTRGSGNAVGTPGGGTISGQPDPGDKLGVALFKEWDSFIASADEVEIKAADAAGKLPALIVKSQVNLSEVYVANKKPEPKEAKGRCLLYASNDKPFTKEELGSEDLVLSPAGKVVFTKNAALSSEECQKVFKDKLADRYKTDFFSLHEVFYGGLN